MRLKAKAALRSLLAIPVPASGSRGSKEWSLADTVLLRPHWPALLATRWKTSEFQIASSLSVHEGHALKKAYAGFCKPNVMREYDEICAKELHEMRHELATPKCFGIRPRAPQASTRTYMPQLHLFGKDGKGSQINPWIAQTHHKPTLEVLRWLVAATALSNQDHTAPSLAYSIAPLRTIP